VPVLGCGLPTRLTDPRTAGSIPAASIRRGRHSKRITEKEASPDKGGEAVTYLPGRWEHLPVPRISPESVAPAQHLSREILARITFCFGWADHQV